MKSFAVATCFLLGLALTAGKSVQENSQQTRSSKPEWYQKLSLNDMTLMEIVQTLARERPDAITAVIQFVTDKITPFSPTLALEMKTKLTTELFDEPTEGSSCNICKTLTVVLKLWAAVQGGYPQVEDNIVDACKLLLTALDENANTVPLCEGVIPLQGPHVYNVLTRSTDVEFCESLNACYSSTPIVPGWPARPASKSAPKPLPQRATRSKRRRRQSSSITIAQLTDVHMELNYTVGSGNTCGLPVCCKYNNLVVNGAVPAHRWGDYSCNIPRETMQLFLDKVEEFKPDYVIFSGDVPPHTVWEETFQSQFDVTATLANAMAATFSSSRVLPSIGNHEMYPTNLFSTKNIQDTQFLLLKFANLWKNIAGFSDSELATMQQAGYYTTVLRPGLRLLSIMTNYMYTANWYNAVNHKTVDAGANDGEAIPIKSTIETILAAARTAGEKVVLVGHHVVGNSDYIVREAMWFEQLTASYSDIIVLQVAGHTHTDEFRLLFDDTNTAKSMVYVSPSIDLHGLKNPSMRVYELDDTTFELLDYTQYYFNLADASDTEPPVITKLYSAREEYGLNSLAPENWFQLLNRFMDDEQLILKHINNEHARAFTEANPAKTSCDEDCRLRHVCQQRYASYDRTSACREQWIVTEPPQTPSTTTRITLPTLTTSAARANRKP